MKIIKFAVLLALSTVACNQENGKQNTEQKESAVSTMEGPQQLSGKKNYQYLNNGDTISLEIDIDGGKVYGNLTYALKEKDKNVGQVEGVLKDSILVADYKFASEGQPSVRQVAFKLSKDVAVEGYGEMAEKEGKMSFIDLNKLEYDQQFPLKSTN